MGQIKTKSFALKLALTDDLKQSAAAMNAATDSINNAIKEVEKADAKVRADRGIALKTQSKEGSVLDKAEKLAKELGVDVNSVGGFKEADNAYNVLEAALKKSLDY